MVGVPGALSAGAQISLIFSLDVPNILPPFVTGIIIRPEMARLKELLSLMLIAMRQVTLI